MRNWVFTPHATLRRKEMGLTEDQVEYVLDHPTLDLPSFKDRRMAYGEVLVVVYDPETRRVVTVLVRSDDCYLDRERDAREMAERLARALPTCHTGSR